MDSFHRIFGQYFRCDGQNTSDCWCKEMITEELSFFLQDSSITDSFIVSLSDLEPAVGDAAIHDSLPLKGNDFVLTILPMFFKFCNEVNGRIERFFNSFGPVQMINESIDKLYVQSLVLSVIFSPDLQKKLQNVIQAYLNLELEDSEISCPIQNIFASVISYDLGDRKTELLRIGRLLNDPKRYIRLEYFNHSVYRSFISSALSHRIRLLCSDNYSASFLDPILEYNQLVVRKHWMKHIFSDISTIKEAQTHLQDEKIYRIFYDVRKRDIFSLIIEFPDSMNALLDLGKCLHYVPFRQDLISHLTDEVKLRLLHPGVHTEQILVAYSYLVRALRIVDKSFLAQDIICRPVSLCLRQREDAVRCIVDKLIFTPESGKQNNATGVTSAPEHPNGDEEEDDTSTDAYAGATAATSTELHSELLVPKPLEVEQADGADDSDADVVAEDPPFDHDVPLLHYLGVGSGDAGTRPVDRLSHWGNDWQPDPVEAMYQTGHWRRRLDLLSMLVSIYGSKKAFLVEYRQLLSQRLLRQRSFQTACELHNLELLKLRFGEQNLYECEVMLKDIRDSRRIASLMTEATAGEPTINPNLQSQAESPINLVKRENQCLSTVEDLSFPLSVYILSVHYWPELLDEHFKLPEEFCATFNRYERLFQHFKANRTLHWMHKLGLVNIDLELGERKLQLDVTPMQVSIIQFFSKQSTWNIRELAQELQTSASNIRHSLQLLLQLGFIRQGSYESGTSCNPAADTYSVATASLKQQTQAGFASTGVSGMADTSWMLSGPEPATSGTDDDTIVSSVRDRKEKELQVFWTYIVAMLTNLGSLSLDRIHSMLRVFALNSTSTLECNREELRQFLDTKIRESQIAFDGEAYRIMRSD